MNEEVTQTEPIAVTQPQTEPQAKPRVLKYVFLGLLGLLLLAGTTYAGYWYGVKSEKLLVSPPNGQPETQTLTPTTPISTPTPLAEDKTKDWKTYTNEDLQYTIKHPNDLKLDELEGVTIFYREKIETPSNSPIDPYIGGFTIYDRSAAGKSAREACEVELCANLSSPEWSLKEININNSVGVKLTSTRPFWANYYLAPVDGTRIVRVILGAEPTQDKLRMRNDFELLESILSTFQFLD